jgi:hypothetical protein
MLESMTTLLTCSDVGKHITDPRHSKGYVTIIALAVHVCVILLKVTW